MKIKRHHKASGSLLAVIICVTLVAIAVPLVALAADGDSYQTLDTTLANADITRISTTSDVHFGEGGPANNRQRFALLLQAMQDFHPQLLIVSGDTFTSSYTAPSTDYYGLGTTSFTSSYDEIRKAARHYLGNIPVVITAGNHDWDVSNYYANNSGYSSYYGLIPTRNFDVFQFGAPNNSPPYNFSTAQIDGLDEYLSDRASGPDRDKPVFVASHYPIDDPTLGATTTPSGETHGNAGNSAAAIQVFQKYDQPSVFLWGHNHNTPRSTISNIFKEHAPNLRTANSGAINFRTDLTLAQGVNVTLDVADDELEYQVIRVDTDSPSSVQQIGTATQDLPAYTPAGGSAVWDGSVAAAFAGGTGTLGDPYLIANGAQLAYLAQQVSGGTASYSGSYFKQTADIDLNHLPWAPIGQYVGSGAGTSNRAFAGTYDGDGYIIKNLTVPGFTGTDTSNKSYALFGNLSGTVQNIGLPGLDVNATNAGSGNAYAGGITGYANGADIINSYVEGDLYANAGTGSGVVQVAGGLAARTGSNATITNSYAAVDVDVGSGEYHGGLVGWNQSGSLTSSYWDSGRHTQGVQNATSTIGTGGLSTTYMKTAAFVDDLNENSDPHKAWIADITPPLNGGYPIHERTAPGPVVDAPVITQQPADLSVDPGDTAALSVAATVEPGGALSYQWFSNSARSTSGGTLIPSATNSTYNAPTAASGTTYYYAEVTNTIGDDSVTRKSSAAQVRVTYLISNAADLADLAEDVNAGTDYAGAYFKQTADIDLSGVAWTPIGQYIGSSPPSGSFNRSFAGTYDGDGFVIANLTTGPFAGSSTSNKAYALFGYLTGTVQNVGLPGLSVNATNNGSGNAYAGGVAGYANEASIINSYAEGDLFADAGTGSNAVQVAGGLAARTASATVTNSYAAADVDVASGNYHGGLVGWDATDSDFQYVYWDSERHTPAVENGSETGTTAKDTDELKATAFVTLLNANRGTYKEWAADTGGLNDGYPIHVRAVAVNVLVWPAASAIDWGQPLSESDLTGGQATVPGAFEFVEPDFVPSAGAYLAGVRFVPENTAYIPITGAVLVQVLQIPLSQVTIAPIADQTYTGSAITPALSVTWGELTLAAPGDYTVEYDDNVSVGEAGVTVTGAGNFTGEAQVTFRIVKATPNVSSWPTASSIPLGQPLEASVLSGGTATPPGGFAFAAPATVPPAVGAFSAGVVFTPTDTANYKAVTGTVSVQVYAPTNAEPPNITAQPQDVTVSAGQAAQLSVTATVTQGELSYQWWRNNVDSNEGGTEIDGADESTYDPPTIAAGTTYYYCVVTNFDDSVTGDDTAVTKSDPARVQVSTISISGATIASIADQTYTGSAITPTPTVTLGETTLVATTDYTVTYAFNVNAGTAQVSVNGQGIYGGSKQATFQIRPATPAVTAWPTADAITLGESLEASALSGGTTSVPGGFAFSAPATVPDEVGSFSADVVFTPTDTANYNTVSGTVEVQVNAVPTDAETPSITQQPADVTVDVDAAAQLTVLATVSHGELSYQWWRNTVDSNVGGTAIAGADENTCEPPTGEVGTTYYYCVVTNYDAAATGDDTAVAKSRAARVRVVDPSLWDGSIATSFASGSGASGDPYVIANGAQLAHLAQQVNGGEDYEGVFFRQAADIDLGEREWTPIGKYAGLGQANYPFLGAYDGDGYVIANLKVAQEYEGTTSNNKAFGLFAFLRGTVKNLGLTGVDVSFSNLGTSGQTVNAYAGGIAGYAYTAAILNSFAEGVVSASTEASNSRCAAGGLVGRMDEGSIANSYAAVDADINGSTSTYRGAGGLVGRNDGAPDDGPEGTFSTSYWNSSLTTNGMNSSSSAVSGASGRSTANMKTAAFVTLLNTYRGTNNAWMSDAILNQGYPIHSHAAVPISIAGATVAPIADQVYTGSAITPAVTVELGGETLQQGAENDYTVAFANNTNAGTAQATVTGVNAYTGTKQATFTIQPATPTVTVWPTASAITFGQTLDDSTLSGGAATFNGNPVAGTFGFDDPDAKPTSAGTYEADVTFDPSSANFLSVEDSVTVQVNPASITGATITVANQTYTGSALTPPVAVQLGGVTLEEGEDADYTVSYEDNVNVGTATVTVTGVGNYTGTKQATFQIVSSEPSLIRTYVELTTPSNTSFAYGGTFKLTGNLIVASEHGVKTAADGEPIGGKTVVLLYRDPGKDWKISSRKFETRADGSFEFSTKPVNKRQFRVRFLGDEGYLPSDLETCRIVTVVPKVGLGSVVAPATAKKGKAFTVYGSLKPKHAKGAQLVRIYKYQKVGTKWVARGYVKAKAYDYSNYTRYKVSIKLPVKGTWRLRAYTPADSLHASTWSAKYDTVKVK